MKTLLSLFLTLLALPVLATGPQLSPSAPKDKPHSVPLGKVSALEAAMAPYVAQARSAYPEARSRFLAGLPTGQSFFVTARLHDVYGTTEQVFIAVSAIHKGMITGRIASQIGHVSGYRLGDPYTLSESDLLDWLITHPDGSEEGNVVGKFLDSYQGDGA